MSIDVQQLSSWGVLRPIDRLFAEAVAMHASPLARAVVAMASRFLGDGHACLPLERLAGRNYAPKEEKPVRFPAVTEMISALTDVDGPPICDVEAPSPRARGAVSGLPDARGPLVLDGKGRLYLRRYYEHERLLGQALLQRLGRRPGADLSQLEVFFPLESTDPAQRSAAEAALHFGLTVISGGPGTGKTSTVVKLLALLGSVAVTKGQRFPRTLLLAPTGKAAARLADSIRGAKERLALPAHLLEAIPEQTSTIHRALGVRPDSGTRFRHGAENPLDVEVVIVDEASMVDLSLMRHLISAVPRTAQVILLGDRDQLASVEAGSVLSELCDVLGAPPSGPAGRGGFVQLEKSYRFSEGSGISSIAQAIRGGDAPEVQRLLELGLPDLDHSDTDGLNLLEVPAFRAALRHFERAYAEGTPEAVLAGFERFRVLCAHRRGPSGVENVNQIIETWMHAEGCIDAGRQSYRGRLVMVTENDPSVGLSNGDVGLIWSSRAGSARGGLSVFFPRAEGLAREMSPAELPAHETAFAMTVHKSQGSEYDHVAVVLPEPESPLLSRELLYTAVTRAKSRVTLLGSEAAIVACVQRRVERFSGLGDALL